jgi:hypothetical protein
MDLHIAHHHPGRLRLRSRAFESGDVAEVARRAVEALVGVAEVSTNAQTGSVLVVYDAARVHADVLVDEVARAAGLVVADRRGRPGDEDRLAYIAIDVVRELNALATELTHHRADLRVLVPAALGGLAIYSFAVDARLPRWDSLLYWSYSVFLSVNQREIEGRHEAP